MKSDKEVRAKSFQCQVKHSPISSSKPDFLKLFDGIDVDFSSASQIVKSALRSESLLGLSDLIRVDYQFITDLQHIYRNVRFSIDLEDCLLIRSTKYGCWEYLHFVKQYRFDTRCTWKEIDADEYNSIDHLLNTPKEVLNRFDKSEFGSRVLEQLLFNKSSYFEHFVHNKGGIIFSASEGHKYTGCDICYLSHAASIISYCAEKEVSNRFLSDVYQNLGCSIALNYQTTEQAEQQVLIPAIYMDPLSGLPNQRGFLRVLRQALETGVKEVYVVVLSIDNFNYFCGMFDDTVQLLFLKKIISALQSYISNQTLSYLGGSEFAYFVSAKQEKQVKAHLEEVLDEFTHELTIENHKIKFDFSAGYSFYLADAADTEMSVSQLPDFLLNLAEIALFQARQNKQVQVMGYKPGMDDELKLQIDLMRHLRGALQREEFIVYFQPITSSENHKAYDYFEALIRWKHPKYGLVGPMSFIQLAEKSGEIIPLGYWMIEKIYQYLSRYELPEKVKIAINLSTVQLKDPALVSKIQELSEKYNVKAGKIIFEITETAAMQDVELSRRKFKQLQSLGFSIAVDDFGTGHSALSYLLEFSLDVLKIDKRFIDHTSDNERYALIAESIIQLAHSLSMEVVCEGIETQEQFAMVKGWGADYIQGYYVSKPQPLSAFFPKA